MRVVGESDSPGTVCSMGKSTPSQAGQKCRITFKRPGMQILILAAAVAASATEVARPGHYRVCQVVEDFGRYSSADTADTVAVGTVLLLLQRALL